MGDAVLALPAVLDIQAAEPLRQAFLAARGKDLTVDGSAVDRLGGLCLQVLLAADRAWEADGNTLRIEGASPNLRDQWAAFGAPTLVFE